ncbi:MAG: hypothetical protein KY475_21035 [Planctomycetes bacterium]|nr:hypothetical protein [Planctomycetota bacterium]
MANAKTSNKPVKTFRFKGVAASVFENVSEDGESRFHKVSVQRIYKQGDEFRSTNSFGRDELPIAVLLMQRAWEFILERESAKPSDAEE